MSLGGIYTSNNPARWVETRKEKYKTHYVNGPPRDVFLESFRVAAGRQRSLQCFGNNSILETPNDMRFVGLES
jgi:hypothetical protein